MDWLDRGVEMLAVFGKALFVLLAAARKMRRNVRILDLVFRAGNDPHPGLLVVPGIALDRREQDDIVDADDIGLHLGKHAGQILLRPFRRLDDHLPAALHVIVDLVVGALAEIGDVAVDEIHPELGHFLRRHGLGQIDRMRLEAIAPVDIEKAGVRQEHHLVAEFLQGLADANRIQRRPEGGFGEKGDHFFCFFRGFRFFGGFFRFRRFRHCTLP